MTYTLPISYSGLSLYKKCPRAWADKYIHGNTYPSGKAAARGTVLHQKLEDYFNNGGAYPEKDPVLYPWREEMYMLATLFPKAEDRLAADSNWEPMDFDDPTANFRGAVDLDYLVEDTLYIKDWKSGKQYDTHEAQAEDYACLGLANYPGIRHIEVEMVYLDYPKTTKAWKFDMPHVVDLQGVLNHDIAVLRADEEHAPTPTRFGCEWCPLSWRRGGTCDKAP